MIYSTASSKAANTDPLFEKYYYSVASFTGGTPDFHSLCSRYVPQNSRILEIGAGPANATTAYLASLGTVDGVDISPDVHNNQYLRAAHVYDGETLPFDDQTFDLCVSNYVLEHIARPLPHFTEVARVLRRGSAYCFRCPNLWHYVTLGSRCLPYVAHLRLANLMRGLGTEARNPYPTVYAANTARRVRYFCFRAGLTIAELKMVEKEPLYGRAHPALFYAMMAYERIVNGAEICRYGRANIFCAAVKQWGPV